MKSQIIDLSDWLKTPPGEYLLAWEREQFDAAVSDVFGFHALQLGLPELPALRANRMPHRWLSTPTITAAPKPDPAQTTTAVTPLGSPIKSAFVCDAAALPFPSASLDLVLLPHTLELSDDPHSALREVERVLVPEGRVVICGLNPTSLWGMRQRRAHFYSRLGYDSLFLPQAGDFIGYWRLRDWLRLLDFEVESASFGCYRPALTSPKWLSRFEWMDKLGPRWWPIFGAVYFVVAVKRVPGTRLLGKTWKSPKALSAVPAVAASRGHKVSQR
jgi:SAM-dependent methyltransferase